MNKKVLIVEDQFVEANDLQLILRKAGYQVCGIARSVPIAQEMIKKEEPGQGAAYVSAHSSVGENLRPGIPN